MKGWSFDGFPWLETAVAAKRHSASVTSAVAAIRICMESFRRKKEKGITERRKEKASVTPQQQQKTHTQKEEEKEEKSVLKNAIHLSIGNLSNES